ncbi:MAG: tetratricopeptide repeat protein [Aureispira sp.]
MSRFLFVLIIIISWAQQSTAQENPLLDKQLQKSVVAFEKGQVAKAERLLDKLIAKEGSYAPAYIWKGKCLQVFEEYSAAYEAYYTACQLQPDAANSWLALGDFKSSLGSLTIRKPAACGDCGKQFLPLNGDRPSAAAYFRSALEDYQKALTINNQLAEVHYQVGLTHAALGEQEAACSAIATANQLGYQAALSYQKEHCNP